MDDPKVSVLIPMYNRKHYIQQCIDSALNQTFQDYEIIIRDNCSTDGGYDFVQEKYAEQISSGKITLIRNNRNLGLHQSTQNLINDARGKYITILHSDDMYLPHTIEHLYGLAEEKNADVVHESAYFVSRPDGIINDVKKDCKARYVDKTYLDKTLFFAANPELRFSQWFNNSIFHDAQCNLFNREFVLKNEIFTEEHDYYYSSFKWIMLSKALVKTPVLCYVRRDSPDSGANAPFSFKTFDVVMEDIIKSFSDMDKLFLKIPFMRDNSELQYMAKARYIQMIDSFFIMRTGAYINGLTPELHEKVTEVFKKYFGELNYFYPMILFNWLHALRFNQRADAIVYPPSRQENLATT